MEEFRNNNITRLMAVEKRLLAEFRVLAILLGLLVLALITGPFWFDGARGYLALTVISVVVFLALLVIAVCSQRVARRILDAAALDENQTDPHNAHTLRIASIIGHRVSGWSIKVSLETLSLDYFIVAKRAGYILLLFQLLDRPGFWLGTAYKPDGGRLVGSLGTQLREQTIEFNGYDDLDAQPFIDWLNRANEVLGLEPKGSDSEEVLEQ